MSIRSYPEYKPSVIEWLGDVPEHWRLMRLKFVARTIMGQSPSSEAYTFDESARPFLQGNAEFGSIYPSPKYFCKIAAKEVPEGSILISVRAPVGAINITDMCYGIGRGLCAVVPNTKLLSLEFTWYMLSVTRNELWSIATGSTYQAVAANEVGAMTLTVPPIFEQYTIAVFLDQETAQIDTMIAKKQRQIELLQEKRAALISHTVTKGLNPDASMKDCGIECFNNIPFHWEIKPLKRVFTVLSGSTPKSDNANYWNGNIPWITPDDLGSLKGDTIHETKRTITQEGYDSCGTTIAPVGSLVLSTRAPIGHLAIAGIPLCTNQGCRSLVVHKNVQNRYFYYQLSSLKKELESWGEGSTFKELSCDKLESFYLLCPPIEEQLDISSFLEKEIIRMDGLINKIKTSIELLNEYRTALISAAVTGKIDVRDVRNEVA